MKFDQSMGILYIENRYNLLFIYLINLVNSETVLLLWVKEKLSKAWRGSLLCQKRLFVNCSGLKKS